MLSRNLKGLALVAALGAVSTVGHALPLNDYDAAVVNVYYGGATATDNTLEGLFLAINRGVCTPGTIDVYRAPNNRVIFCRVDNTRVAGFPAAPGLKVAFHKESRGGSSNGVNPLIDVANGRASDLLWLDLARLRAETTQCAGVAVAPTAALNGYINHASCSNLLTPADTAGSAGAAGRYDANGGISDVEPSLSFPAPSTADIARLTSVGGLGIIFGVPVTNALYAALQVAQGLNGGAACDTPAERDGPGCVPTLTRSQVRALYTGSVTNWDSFTNGAGIALSAIAGVTAPADSEVYICRRVATSGTQASFETYFLNQRCAADTATFVGPDDASGILDVTWNPPVPNGNTFVNAGPSSGNVRSCMALFNGANRWAVGVLSTEVSAANLTDGQFRMVKVDGAPPTLEAVANGDYDFFTENTLNRVRAGSTGAIPVGDPRATLLTYVEANIGLPLLVSQINAGFVGRPWGNGGVMTIPGTSGAVANPSPATATDLLTNPVNTQSRFGNNCATPTTVLGQPVDNVTGPRY